MSFSQRQLWYLQRLNPTSSAYNVPLAVYVDGALSVPALSRAFTRLVNSVEVLRTTYELVDGEPMQIVGAEAVFELEPEPCEGWSDARIRDEVHREARRPFDLQSEPSIRVRVLRQAPERWVVLWSLHHIAVDPLAVSRLGEALARAYEEESAGPRTSGDLVESELEYADYVVGQNEEFATGRALGDRLDYWRRHLDGAPHVLELPEDHPRTVENALEGGEFPFRLDPALREPLLDAARSAGVSPFILLLSAFKVTVGGYVAQEDIVTGVPFANRPRGEFDDVIGLFMNLLPIRVGWTEQTTVGDLLQDTRSAMVDGERYQDTPFEKIVEALDVRSGPAVHPLVQTWFTYQEPPQQLRLPGLSTRTVHPHNGGAKLDLSARLWDSGEAIEGTIEFASGVFEPRTIERFVEVFEHVLDQMIGNSETRVGQISLLPPSQARTIQGWQGVARPLSVETLAEGLLRSFDEHRDRFSVRDRNRRWSYADLEERARAVGASLASTGIGRGDRVGVCLGRSTELLSTLIGVLLSGAAYVPLDPRFPKDRLRFILEDSGCSSVVVDSGTEALVESIGGKALRSDGSRLGPDSGSFEPVRVSGDDPAYLIYTSGSTGQPKGVAVPHRAVVNLLDAMARVPGCTSDDVLAAVTTLSFDISVLELFLPLWVGGECAILDEDAVRNGRHLIQELRDVGATLLQATPATWRLLVQAGAELPGVRALCGGEALPSDLAETLPGRVDTLFNMYGPTETTIWSTCGSVEAGEGVTIGRPIQNTRIMIADSHGRPTPLGVPGEIWIGGTGVALGYRNRDELTASRFITRRSERWYRTGDLGRWLGDARLRHLGRLDRQLKVRGFRIEPGEVEAAINEMDGVAACVVTAVNFGTGDDRLAAYLVAPAGVVPPTSTEVRSAVRTRLPDYMVPNVVVPIADIPLLPNGKLDLSSLPDPAFGGAGRSKEVELRPGLESDMARIWRQLLQIRGLSPTDSFFDLGGHSLLAMRAVAAMQKDLGVKVEPRSLFFMSLRQVVETVGLEAHA